MSYLFNISLICGILSGYVLNSGFAERLSSNTSGEDTVRSGNDSCVLPPKIDNGEYTVGRSRKYKPGDEVPNVVVLIYSCNYNHALDADSYSFCVNGNWTTSPKCHKYCDALGSSTVDYECLQPSGITSSCEKQQPSGTIASSRCKHRYSSNSPLVQLTCIDGNWDNPKPKCSIPTFEKVTIWEEFITAPCIMPEHPPNGRYIAGANRNISPGDELPAFSVLITECNKGYATSGNRYIISCDGHNNWSRAIKCQKTCPPLVVPHVKFACEMMDYETWPYSKKKISCLEPVKNGSIASGDCMPYFYSESIIPSRTCVNGVWDKPPPVCKPKRWGRYIPTVTNGSCVLPDHDVNGQYVYNNDIDITTGYIVKQLSVITYKCNEGYELNGDSVSVCLSGSWNKMPKCLKTCNPLISITVDLTCTHGGTIVSCLNQLKNGTTVESNCKESYSSSDPFPILVCNNGNWNKEPPRCTPECGTIIPKGKTNIVNGSSAELGEFPWHVGLYVWDNRIDNYTLICGGSIVNAKLVVTAAHCVWDNDKNVKSPASNYAVAGVKYYREWRSDKENENLVQRSLISEIVLPDEYGGYLRKHQADIALLTLNKPFKFNSYIRPVCLDWKENLERRQLSNGNYGKVTGWGLTDVMNKESYSSVLLTVRIPFVDYNKCLDAVSEDFIPFIGVDKICAGYKDEGTAVCKGDSGGGLVFASSIHSTQRWYLRGIVSVSPYDPLNPDTCHSETYAAFTRVIKYATWLRKEISERIPY